MSEDKKNDVKDFLGKAKKIFNRGLVASKKALGVAGDAVHDFSDKSVVRIEKAQLESKLKKQFEVLGEYSAALLASKKSVTSSDKNVQSVLVEIKRLQSEIKIREDSLTEDKPKEKKSVQPENKIEVKTPSKTATQKKAVSSKTTEKKTTKKTTTTAATKSVAKTSASKTTATKKPTAKKSTATKKATTKESATKK